MSNVNKVPISRLAAVQNIIVIHSYAKVQKKRSIQTKIESIRRGKDVKGYVSLNF